jgi:pSer/pThr/pTyr-binding forkhead associated (FHA) protein
MAKLVVLSEGLNGQTYELKVDKTTIGRVDDNTFQIAQPSVSSHHCEVLLRGPDVVVKDLNSTNGTFINGQPVTNEAVLKPGEVLRLGQVEIRLETGSGGASPAPATSAPVAPASGGIPAAPMTGKRPMDSTMVIPKGVSLEQLEQGPQPGFDTSRGGFTKKKDKTNKYFIIGGIVFAVVILIVFLFLLNQIKPSGGGLGGH